MFSEDRPTGSPGARRQLDALTAAGCRKIFADKKSGKNALRPELKACHAFLDPGDTLVVPSLDRYGRSLQDLINMVAELRTRGIGFTSLHENLDTTTPGGRLVHGRVADAVLPLESTHRHAGPGVTVDRRVQIDLGLRQHPGPLVVQSITMVPKQAPRCSQNSATSLSRGTGRSRC
ncbi:MULTISPECIES: recombinase family protein [unclassified Streptomyces]|uniref:recombinase family protein n=1 Tax=unclassified Streptomyces TaxID=2593676 RepID=UPI0035D854A8